MDVEPLSDSEITALRGQHATEKHVLRLIATIDYLHFENEKLKTYIENTMIAIKNSFCQESSSV